jgi:hypothetical protein
VASALATADASAASWHVAGSTITSNVALAMKPAMATAATFTTSTTPAVTIECVTNGGLEIGESVLTPPFEGRDGLFNFLSYGTCAVVSPLNCGLVGTKLVIKSLKMSVIGTAPVELTLSPLTGTTLFEATVKGTGCPSPTTVKATGTIFAELETGGTEATTHGLKFKAAGGGGSLTAAKGTMTLKVVSGSEWSYR